MSLLPALLSELIGDYRRTNLIDLHDQNFGLGLLEDELLQPSKILAMPLRSGYLRPWRSISAEESGLSTVQADSNEFKVSLDVQQFKPEELKVKVEGNLIVVDAKHEERTDQHGFISRQFSRKYVVPEDVDINALVSNLSSDGVLSLKAPKKNTTQPSAREIPITHTNVPAVKKEEVKAEAKPEPAAESKPEPKLEPKPEPKLEPKPEAKAEPTAEAKVEPKVETNPETKAEEPKPQEPKSEEPKPEEPKPEAKPDEAKPEPEKAEVKPEEPIKA